MSAKKLYTLLLAMLITGCIIQSCTKLDQKVYSVVPNSEFWSTPDQIASGIAPAYGALTALTGNTFEVNECTSDEFIIPIRGSDWLDANVHIQEWQHTWQVDHNNINGAWGDIYNGIGKANFTLSIVNALANPPSNLAQINAEVKTLRDFYYFLALDMFGSVPYVTSFNVDPSTVTNNLKRADIYDSIVTDINANLPLLSTTVDPTTYGRFTRYTAFALLAKLYLNAQVYTGSTDPSNYTKAASVCDSIILSGKYSLLSNFFDNFSPTNSNLTGSGNENIFVVPFDKVNIGGMNFEMSTLHYQSNLNFGLSGSPWNGFCSTADFYSTFDTSSVYALKGTTTFRTFNDQRAGQYLVGQQYAVQYSYPPSTSVIVNADPSLAIIDAQTKASLNFVPTVGLLSDASPAGRLSGVRNIKYFPEAGTAGNASNDWVVFRLSDIYLMKAEAEVRAGTVTDGLTLVNSIRTRAYGGDASHNWVAGQLTLDNILAERGRELTWEGWRRNDMVRYEVVSGTPYFSAARNPGKNQDPSDGHLLIFPIPKQQITANPNLKQNPGY